MKVSYAKTLVKDLEAVSRNPAVKKRLSKLIETFKAIDTLDENSSISRKLKAMTVITD